MASATEAAVIYSQALVNPFAGLGSNDPASGGSNQRIADDFTLGAGANVASLTWWGLFTTPSGASYGGTSPLFSVRFYADAGGGAAPALDPFLSVTVTAAPLPTGAITSGDNHAVFAYSATLPSVVSLLAGTYWLSIVESDAATVDGWEWVPTELGLGTADNMRRIGDPLSGWIPADPFGQQRRNQAFVLDDDPIPPVPEPASLLLLGASLVGLRAWKKRRG